MRGKARYSKKLDSVASESQFFIFNETESIMRNVADLDIALLTVKPEIYP